MTNEGIESLSAEVISLKEKLQRVTRPPDERMKDAASMIKALQLHIQLLEGKTASATSRTSQLQQALNDSIDGSKDRKWFLVIEMDEEYEVTMSDNAADAMRIFDKSGGKSVFLCSVIKGPLQMLDKLTGAFRTMKQTKKK